MTDITLGTLPAEATAAKPAPAAAKKSFFQRLFDAMVEARTRQAERLIRDLRADRAPGW